MHRREFVKSALVAVGGVAAVLGTRGRVRAADEPRRALRAALFEMKAAKEDLKDDKFKRRREKAEKDLDVAIDELERALKWAKVDVRYEAPKNRYEKFKDFRHLHAAMEDLELAEKEVRDEKGDWGGRRKELERAIEDARARVKEAMEDIK